MRVARTSALLVIVSLLVVARVAPGQETDAPAAPAAADAPAATDAPAAGMDAVQLPEGELAMVKLSVAGRTVLGRLVSEDDQVIRIEALGGGVTGYAKATIGITRFTVSLSGYHEQNGDHYRQKAWESEDGLGIFAKARFAYQEAAAYSDSDEALARLAKKLAALEAEREEWHAERERRIKQDRARHENELLRIQAQLTQEKLAALERQGEQIQQMSLVLQRIQDDNRRIVDRLRNIDRELDDLDDDIDRLRNLDRHYTRTTVFLDLKGSHDNLVREVERMRRDMGRR